jgi:hypothetical protein
VSTVGTCLRVLLLVALAANPACAQTSGVAESKPAPTVLESQGPAISGAVPRGWIAGRVIDEETGAPIAAAQVILGREGAISDSVGSFRLPLPSIDSVGLVVRRIGYGTYEAGVPLTSGYGYATVVALRLSDMPLCGDPISPVWTLAIHVRDAVSGANLVRDATLRVHDGSFREAAKVRDTLPYLVAVENRPGVYMLEVRHPGYRPWSATGVQVENDLCGVVKGRVLNAWLLPL